MNDLTPNEAAMVKVLVDEAIARYKHPPHVLISARDKLRAIATDA